MARFHLALTCVEGVGPMAASLILDAFPDAESAFGASTEELRRLGLSQRQAEAVVSFKDFGQADRLLEEAERHGQRVLPINDPAYPGALRTIAGPPPVLFVRGRLVDASGLAASVVGTRTPTIYGERVARRLGAALAKAEVWTISGGARGIDAQAHRGALDAGGGTVAVLGTDLDVAYPPEHAELFERIVENGGALLSELPVGTQPLRANFPRRNRILAGLGRALVIVEAGERSGALITARYAAEQGKPILAVPGRIDSAKSRGANQLIRDGARPLLELADIVEEVCGEHLRRGPAEDESLLRMRPEPPAPGDAGAVWDALIEDQATTDQLVAKTGLTAPRVNAVLMELELLGRVVRRPGNVFIALVEDG